MKDIKKLLALLLALAMIFTFAACGGESASEEPAEEPAQEEPAETAEEPAEEPSAETETPGKTLVVYFSRVGNSDFSGGVDAVSSASLIDEGGGEFTGNAQKIAEIIADETGGDIVEVVVKKPYPGDYNETVEQAKNEQNEDARPELVTSIENLGEYGTVYLAFPNWWGDLPMALYTFFDEYDFSGKTIKAFATHEGSGFSGTIGTIEELEPGAEVIEGLSIRGSDVPDAESDIRDWVKNN